MNLTDPVAQHVMGAMHVLTQRIDAIALAQEQTAKLTNNAANNVVASIRQVLGETEEKMRSWQKGTQVDVRFAEQLKELNRITKLIGDAREKIPKEVREIAHNARDVALTALEHAKANAGQAFFESAEETMHAATSKYKMELKTMGAVISVVAVVIALLAAIAGYQIGKQTGYTMAQLEIAAVKEKQK